MKIGKALVEKGLLSPEELQLTLDEQDKTKERLGDIAVKNGFVRPEKMAPFLAQYFNLPYLNLRGEYKNIKPEIIKVVSEEIACRFSVLPFHIQDSVLTLVMHDPLDVFAEDTIRMKTGLKIRRVVASREDILEAIDYCYHQLPRLKEHIEDFVDEGVKEVKIEDFEKLRIEASDPPVVKYVHHLVVEATNNNASDIHIKPKEDKVELKFRIDSVLYDFDPPPKSMLPAIITRIKILAGLDIAERRLPQDGRFRLRIGSSEVDVRTSCFPNIYGESIVMRLLNTSAPMSGMHQLGFSSIDLEEFKKLIHFPYGLILVTGPTGSGKTTTLYTTLNEIKSPYKNIVTLEDPVEYRLPFIQQSQVNPLIGFDFARGLRSLLRQDPDVVMVGEIRDKETAEIAIHASLTGHLVFSTLHTNDAAGAAVRLINMGVEPYLITSSLIAVLAQRLVRKICLDCRKDFRVENGALEKLLDTNLAYFSKGDGCPNCLESGYKGRTAIFELLVCNDAIRKLILARVSSEEIRKQARLNGMKTLRESGIEKVKFGISTFEEVLRVTQLAEEN